ncbi:MAG TPA: type II secretion system protein N [Usitatibacter sp.]|nr:type II secretion system protein N [Usitatibacter sp.]
MAIAPQSPQARPEGAFGTIAIVALVLVLAWQLAHWTWVFFAPATVAGAQGEAQGVNLAAIARLFGAAAPDAPVASPGGLRLKGVIAPDSGPMASAIFSTGSGRDVTVMVDHEVQKGVTLAEVRPEYVVISRAGARERIDLEAPRSSAAGKAGLAARSTGFRITVARSGANNYTLSRKELDNALRDPNQLSYLGVIGVPPGGGVRMDAAPDGSLAQKLGLKPGDVIKRVNGQPVLSTGDLARLYTQFATTSLIQADVQRGATTVQLSYAIQP